MTEDNLYPDEQVAIIDEESGEPLDFSDDKGAVYEEEQIIQGGVILSERRNKVYVSGVDVSILNERVQYLDADGKIITESLKDYTKRNILKEYRTMDEFLTRWNKAEKKKAIVTELEEQGIIFENLREVIKKDLDIFDLICHVAWDTPPLTRRERADNITKRNYFTKYGEQARNVIAALLDKYADEGIDNIEDLSVLKIEPFTQIGTPTEIIKIFGGKDAYLAAIKELETEIYKAA